MMAFIHIVEHGKGIGKSYRKRYFDALIKLGDGDLLKGFFIQEMILKIHMKMENKKSTIRTF